MTAISVTVVGNLTGDPQLRFTATGTPVASFTIASNERYKQGDEWKDGPVSFVRCNAWRELAEHITESAKKGDRVIATGIMRQRDYETKDREKRTVWEVAVTEVGAALRYATVTIKKTRRDSAPVPDDPWASREAPADDSGFADEPPF